MLRFHLSYAPIRIIHYQLNTPSLSPYYRIVQGMEELNHSKRNLPGGHTVFEMKNIQLQQQEEYQFWITAVTRIGEGQSSAVVSQTASSKSELFISA